MAGLLPSERKLRGSPANILGDASRGKISRAFFFSEHDARVDFYLRNFARFITKQTHHAAYRAHIANNARRATREKSVIYAGLRAIAQHKKTRSNNASSRASHHRCAAKIFRRTRR
jgi:hypothetical protein